MFNSYFDITRGYIYRCGGDPSSQVSFMTSNGDGSGTRPGQRTNEKRTGKIHPFSMGKLTIKYDFNGDFPYVRIYQYLP